MCASQQGTIEALPVSEWLAFERKLFTTAEPEAEKVRGGEGLPLRSEVSAQTPAPQKRSFFCVCLFRPLRRLRLRWICKCWTNCGDPCETSTKTNNPFLPVVPRPKKTNWVWSGVFIKWGCGIGVLREFGFAALFAWKRALLNRIFMCMLPQRCGFVLRLPCREKRRQLKRIMKARGESKTDEYISS